MRTGSRPALVSLIVFFMVTVIIDVLSEALRGLWAPALVFVLGWLLIWRTVEEMEPAFTGPERHRLWLQATGWFFVVTGVIDLLLALLPILTG